MDREHLESRLDGIRHLLSHLHGEVTALESAYTQVLSVLRRLEDTAIHDDLTGLLRRNAFFGLWEKILEECAALNSDCGVLVIDIDHFKKINDTFGHDTGDTVIKKIAELLKTFEGPHCVVGRLGGEEFAVAMTGTDAELVAKAEQIRRKAEHLHGPVGGSNVEWTCTLSIGVGTTKSSGCYDPTPLLKSADTALYEAKKRGRNQVRAA